jgi:hypothetical protein
MSGEVSVANAALEGPLVIRCLTVLLSLAAVSISATPLMAQDASSSERQRACMEGFTPLREDAENKGKLIKAASQRLTPPREACELFSSYAIASAKMIRYVEANAAECSIPASILEQLKAGYQRTDDLRIKICAKADQSATPEGAPNIRFQGSRRSGAF